MCAGPTDKDCVQCIPGLKINDLNQCVECVFLNPGLTLNEELECEDRCGDGVIVNKPCDDGNSISGDGCSSECQIEFGYECDAPPGQPCKEVIPPKFAIIANSKTNLHFIEFSEAISVASETTISPSNMKVEIVGKRPSYKFSWRLIDDLNNQLIPGREISRF